MKALKIIGSAVLILICLTLILFSGSLLLQALPREKPEPAILSTDQLFPEEVPVELPAEEPAETPPTEEEAPAEEPKPPVEEEEPPTEEPPVEEPPAEEEIPAATAQWGAEAWLANAQAYLDTMTLEEKIWQLFLATPEQLTQVTTATVAGEATRNALETMPVGGLCYFAPNLETQEQAQALLTTTQTYAKTPLFLAVDEEGGRVSRAGANESIAVTHIEAAAVFGAQADMAQVYNAGKTMAQELLTLGFNLNFAPVADVVTNPNNTEIGDRSYSSDPTVAGPLVSAMVEGLQRSGMAACLKHFPGHGSTEVDSHTDTAVSNRTLQELRETEWLPFRLGLEKGAAFVMVGHLTNENLSALPASLSPEIIGCLREELGFRGIVITDSLQMGAIVNHYTSSQAAVMALQAGADMLLMPNDLATAYAGIEAAVADGTLTEERINESVLRILATKYQFGIME